MVLVGTFFLNVSLIFDTLDGQYARHKNMGTEFGKWYDQVCDAVKYVVIFVSLSIGFYFNPNYSSQLFVNKIPFFTENKELILILGMIVIYHLFIIYFIHASRYQLTFNPGNIVSLGLKHRRNFFIGIESTLYTIFTVFLICYQIYLLFIILAIFLPIMWIYPFYLTYKNCKK
jgi:phosphatidylglycerophosphate synthase